MRSPPLPKIVALLLSSFAILTATAAEPSTKPNIVYIMADELGYFEPGFNGGTNIKTPNLDRMAAGGIRFTNIFAGSSVCAPTRCCLMTGKHSGHTSVRVNGGGTPLRADETTIASMLKPLGYATGGFGKWGVGGRDSTGVPEKHGFDQFFGYYDQVHAHSYYPPYLIRNSEEVPLPGNNGGSQGDTYAHYEIHSAAMQFIREQAKQQKPFFAYLPYTPPHGLFDIPDSDPAWAMYKDQPWPESARRYAAMVGMVDRQVGEVLALLKELGIEQNTLVMFSGDNGGADYFTSPEHPRGVHSANKDPKTGIEFRGKKGQLYEGGLRVPFVASWPGKIAAGSVSEHLGYFPDVLPTIAEMTGAKAPAGLDGLSLLPTLIGEKSTGHAQKQHDFLYWEIGGATAIRQGTWRAVQNKPMAKWELYDLATDPSESKDLAAAKPDIVATLEALATAAHTPAVEGTFASTDRHERDRRAKTGQHDNPAAPDPLKKAKPNANASVMPTKGILSYKDWKIVRVSSENVGNEKFARNAIDGDPATLWHTRFTGVVARPPHELVIDLGAQHTVRGFVYLARQDEGWNGAIKEVDQPFASAAEIGVMGEDEKLSKNVRVGVYVDEGAGASVNGLLSVVSKFDGVSVTKLKAEDFQSDKLAEFDLLLHPGGSGGGQGRKLGKDGREAIRQFVQSGGGFIGICAGSYLASADYEWSLHILDAKVVDRQHWNRGKGSVDIGLTDEGRKLLRADEQKLAIHYAQGPLLTPGNRPDIEDYEVLATFETEIAKNGAPQGVMKGTTAIAKGTFGSGRVICFSPHPELTNGLEQMVHLAIDHVKRNRETK